MITRGIVAAVFALLPFAVTSPAWAGAGPARPAWPGVGGCVTMQCECLYLEAHPHGFRWGPPRPRGHRHAWWDRSRWFWL